MKKISSLIVAVMMQGEAGSQYPARQRKGINRDL
jgi:hypothetical protein